MAVLKNTRNKRAVLFIDDFGQVYSLPIVSLQNFLVGVHGLTVLTRLPFNTDPSRFKRSPVFWNGRKISAEEWDVLPKDVKVFKDYGVPDYMAFVVNRRKGDISTVNDFEV